MWTNVTFEILWVPNKMHRKPVLFFIRNEIKIKIGQFWGELICSWLFVIILSFCVRDDHHWKVTEIARTAHKKKRVRCTVPKSVPIIGIRSLQGPFWRFGSLFIFQGPYFQCFGFIHAKNCKFSLHVYNYELTWSVCEAHLLCNVQS